MKIQQTLYFRLQDDLPAAYPSSRARTIILFYKFVVSGAAPVTINGIALSPIPDCAGQGSRSRQPPR